MTCLLYTSDQVQGTLENLFDRQYILTEDVVVEVRYRTESRTDSEGSSYTAVSYTHLDVYKRQGLPRRRGTPGFSPLYASFPKR